MTEIFAAEAPKYREIGYWPRPIAHGTKACKIKNWQTPDTERDARELDAWLTTHANHGIGLLLGSTFPDGTVLGGLDIDRDDYVRVTKTLLFDPPCGRIGSRGILYFVRIAGDTAYRELKIRATEDHPAMKIGELLIANRLAVIPPTIHPSTNAPYRWIGPPLRELPFSELPLLEV